MGTEATEKKRTKAEAPIEVRRERCYWKDTDRSRDRLPGDVCLRIGEEGVGEEMRGICGEAESQGGTADVAHAQSGRTAQNERG